MEQSPDIDKKIIILSSIIPFIISFCMVLVFLIEQLLHASFSNMGVYPRDLNHLHGIVFSPFIHGDLYHLLNNIMPFFFLTWTLLYFYRRLAYKILILSWIFSGFFLWLGGREAFHIGASGVIYALAAFLFLSGFIRGYYKLIAISLLIVFLYGYMVWGIFPSKPSISWEGHLWGMITGLALAVIYKNEGPKKPLVIWDEEDEVENNTEIESSNNDHVK